jgi:predicted Rossmann fold flavoprotein
LKIIIIGGGAAGFFAAITAAEANPKADIIILERGKDVLQKVKISGGGRCNVTHACFVSRDLVKNYPRGERELMSPFSKFAAGDTIDWFDKHGVELKIEDDGRMFPVSDDSQTIVDCLYNTATRLGVKVLRGFRVDDLAMSLDGKWQISTAERRFQADKLMLATGSSTAVWAILARLGHTIVTPVPSLFTFNIKDERLKDLLGISVPMAEVSVENEKLKGTGPLLITHWGVSGPAILKMSAWGARVLHQKNYHFKIKINWTNGYSVKEVEDTLNDCKLQLYPKKYVSNTPQYDLPNRLWQRLVTASEIGDTTRWAEISKRHIQNLAGQIAQGIYEVRGKSTYKDEFVTAGGVRLDEVNFKTFESKLLPNLYFAGEVLDIDAITGGFNFQAAWSGAWTAGKAMAIANTTFAT